MIIYFGNFYKIKTLVKQEFQFIYGADDGNRTHEMPEPQSGALTTSPHPPCSTAYKSIYKNICFVKRNFKKIKISCLYEIVYNKIINEKGNCLC